MKLYVWVVPSLTDRSLAADRVTVGATLRTLTVWVAVLLLALSESLAWIETMLDAGPSGNEQTKLPPERVVAVRPTCVPWRPQSALTTLKVSAPGSVTVNE